MDNKWNSYTEALTRDVGDYVEKQMKDLLNAKASVPGSSLRILFRHVTSGIALKREAADACHGAGYPLNDGWVTNLKRLVELAEQNGSDAADKIKKALPVVAQLQAEFDKPSDGLPIAREIKIAKKLNLQY